MRLLRDLWVTSPRRTAVVACLIVLGAGGQVVASAVAGPVLVRRSTALFIVLAAALLAAAVSNLVVDLTTAGLTADWAADVRCRLCRVALGQDLPTLETTPVGELLDRIDGDVYQVAAELRGHGVRIAHASAMGVLSIVIACVVWWPAGLAMLVLAALLAVGLSGPTRKISPARMGEEEAWSDLAAVMEESIHGQDDVRTTLARPYVLRLYAQRASQVLARGRTVWTMSARVTTIASGVIHAGIAAVVLGGVWALATDRIDSARLTATWLLALAFGGTVEQVSRMVPQLQYALGAWRRAAAGPARRTPDLPAGPLLRLDRPDRVREVHAGQGPHAGRRRPARRGVPRRDRSARPGRRGLAPVGRCRPAAHRDPDRDARREHRPVRPGPARTGGGRCTSWA